MESQQLITDMRVRKVKEIFLDAKAPLQIPKYQRAYAWKNDEISDFVNDMYRLYQCRKNGKPDNHFLGGIVAYEEENKSIPQKVYYIVDGQQRLITFLLLFSVIQYQYGQLADNFRKAQDKDYMERADNKLQEVQQAFAHDETDYLGRKHTVRTLTASKADEDFLNMVLERTNSKNDQSRESHQLILQARNKLERDLIKKIKDDDDKSFFLNLSILLECIKQDCVVIFIVCPNLSDAYELFQVLNDRGKSLTDGDLLRAHTFQLIHDFQSSDSESQKLIPLWDEILSEKESKVKHFLEQYYRIQTGKSPQKRHLYRQYQEEIFNQAKQARDTKEIIRIVEDVRDKFRVFSQIMHGDWPYEVIHQSIEDYDKECLRTLITILGLNNVSILLIAAFKQSQPKFRDIMYLIEKFFFRYKTICGGPASKIGDTFGQFAYDVQRDAFDLNKFKKALHNLLEDDSPDGVFSEELKLSLNYEEKPGTKQRIRFFLFFLEDHRSYFDGSKRGQQKRDKSSIHPIVKSNTLEHIYPQTPETGQADEAITKHKTRGNLTNSIGNLTVLGPNDNSNLGNKAFHIKRSHYNTSNTWLNREIAEKQQWSADEILEREKVLLDRAVKIFKI